MSLETWVQLGAGIVLTVIAPLLNELFWKSLVLTLGGFCFGVALWQFIENHNYGRAYFLGGCALLAAIIGSFIIWSAPKQVEQHGEAKTPTNSATDIASAKPSTSPMTVPPPSDNRTVLLKDGRIIVDVTPEYLIRFFKEHTEIQASKLVAPYIGKWMKFSYTIGDITDRTTYISVYSSVFTNDSGHIDVVGVTKSFNAEWCERLSVLRKGDNINVLGQIKEFNPVNIISLSNCELVDS